ncbi:hypothetical protein E1293_40590 [Actinomadura darangshiensis]|uniref:Uncharacterized protein n=1 Tax=Actinomadura darangshiensis TaxID=705336 RepID=A0A4R5A195_9ACTN|nr:hypothetical protein [Actinomadura darangshiensis]TDD65175.1 hypothetical protein E1293_40590 [Actinomadura darangshiensis]
MPSSIPRRSRSNGARKHVKTTSLRALAVAAQLERNHAQEGPPGNEDGRVESRPERRTPDPA